VKRFRDPPTYFNAGGRNKVTLTTAFARDRNTNSRENEKKYPTTLSCARATPLPRHQYVATAHRYVATLRLH
jgi:hypothetical protein